MTKSIALIVILLFTMSSVFSQERFIQNAHIGVLYPVSTNGRTAAEYTNRFSLHLFSGLSKNERAFAFYGLAGVVKDSAGGLLIAGISGKVGAQVRGLQFAGIVNTAASVQGLQVAGILNQAGSSKGGRFVGVLNDTSAKDAAPHWQSMQIAGLMNRSLYAGIQVAGLVNGGWDNQIQVAGLVNRAQSNQLQIAGLANQSPDGKIQVAGLLNRSSRAALQVGGLVNQADNIHTQIGGLVNIAGKVRGVQLSGLLNIADSSDYPIGLINLIKNGEMGIALSVDETQTTTLAFRSGGRVLYGIVGLGYNFKPDTDLYALEAGIGAHITGSRPFRLNAETTFQTLTDFHRGEYFKSSIRTLAAWRLLERMELFAGPSLNYIWFTNGKGKELTRHYIWNKTRHDRFNCLAFGAIAGVQVDLGK